MGAIEDAQHSGLGQGLPHSPQEVVLKLLVGRSLEAVVVNPLRVNQSEDVADHSTLTSGVEPLENDEHASSLVRVTATAGEQRLLQLRELLGHRLELLEGPFLVPRCLRSRAGINLADVNRGLRAAQHIGQLKGVFGHVSSSFLGSCSSILPRPGRLGAGMTTSELPFHSTWNRRDAPGWRRS